MFLDWNTSGRDCYVIDIETDGLDASVIWVMCWKNIKTGETGEARNIEDIRKFFTDTAGSIYVGHNICKYDAPVLGHLAGVKLGVGSLIDTLVLSTLYSPSLSGGHSLEAWGQTLGREKIEFDDWSHLSEEMVTYCHKDVEITCELFQKLIRVLKKIGFSEQSIWLQHRLTVIIDRQQRNGFYFDGPRAIDLYRQLRSREEELQNEIRSVFPPTRTFIAERPMYTKDGRPTAIYLKDQGRYLLERCEVGGRYSAFEDVEFNIGSPKQRIDKLMELGWEPLEFTEKGSPKPFDKGKLSPSLERFLEEHPRPEVSLIAKWMSINGRANMINTWLENWDENDGCIHGSLFVANTLRFRHQKPNTANIPAVRVSKDTGLPVLGEEGYYTYEARDLWTARPSRVLVGTDAAGLELRMLADRINNPRFTEQVIEGDPHQANADMVGITRPQAKTILYASMYGASGKKIATTLGISVREGTEMLETFLSKLGIDSLIKECKKEQANGRIELIDGSKIICPSPHAALNYKLQGNGARVMGLALVLLDRHVKKEKLDTLFVGNIHDEIQCDVLPEHADRYAELSIASIREAGELLNCNVPLDGTAKKGLTWSQTH